MRALDRFILALLRPLLRLLVRHRSLPEDPEQLGIDRSRPVCYALHIRQLSAFLVLDDAARRLGLPLPSSPLDAGARPEPSSFFFLTRSGQPSPLRRNPYEYSKRLERLLAAVEADPALDVQIVPVSIFWGRAPDKQDSVLKALFADSWGAPGFLRQGLRLLIHGRQTQLRFGAPISLRSVVRVSAGEPAERRSPLRRIGRLLRTEFRRERELAVGPNLSHRQTLINVIVDAPQVRSAIDEEAARRRITTEQAELAARRIAYEIASDYSYPFIRAYDVALTALWNRIYSGVEVHRFEDIAQAGAGAEIVYVPCHRSHFDYLLLSYVIYHRGLLPPHIAAGGNLNLPVVGALLRKGGAFFLRRSFKGEALFAAVFKEYLHTIMRQGFPIEYFVEGGRSRTGRMLPPKTGMLGMTVDSHLRAPGRPVVFVPVYIGYEQIFEGDSYVAELSGQPKRKETLGGLLRAIADIRGRRFGKVHVNIGEPIRLDRVLEAHWPDWRSELRDSDGRGGAAAGGQADGGEAGGGEVRGGEVHGGEARTGETGIAGKRAAGAAQMSFLEEDGGRGEAPARRPLEPDGPLKPDPVLKPDPLLKPDGPAERREATVKALGREIVTRINDALVINPVNLLATAMQGPSRLAMDAGRLAEQIDLLASLAARLPYSRRQQLSAMEGAAIIAHAQRQGWLERIEHPLGDIVRVVPRQAPLLAYFRNNVLHAWALPSLVACLVLRDPRITIARMRELTRQLFPFLRAEMFLSWPEATLDARVDACIDLLAELGLLDVEGAVEADQPAVRLRDFASRARDGALLLAPGPNRREALALQGLAQVISQPLERYFLTVKALVGSGSGTLSPAALEERCVLLAERFAYLHEPDGPDFTDPVAFRSVVATLQEAGLAQLREGALHFGPPLQRSARDADHLLSEEVRSAIAHAGELPQSDLERAPDLGAHRAKPAAKRRRALRPARPRR
jgi:glycerol-3-phosphate O-acyltransferase